MARNIHEPSGRGTQPASSMSVRKLRGALLRFVRRRALAMAVGLALAAPAAWIEFSGHADAWWLEGLALVAGATGLALFWTGLVGVAPDWTEDR